jgi:serine/threonine protein phosphatase 1
MVTMGRFVFVHAGLRPGVPLERQTEDDLLFIRDDFLGHRGGFDGRIVVHGHTPQIRAERVGARIGVDTGAYATGLLACAVLEGRDERFIQVRSTWA